MIKKFEAGERIFSEGDIGKEAYLIKSGHVSVWRLSNGEKVHLAVKDEGQIIGEMSLLDETDCSASITAETPVELQVITRDDLAALLNDAPELLSQIMSQLMESLRSANDLVAMYSSRIDG